MPNPPSPLPVSSPETVEWLREQREPFDHLVASVEDYAIFMMSLDGTILDWNAGAARLKGYTAGEIVGQNFSRFYSPEDLDRHLPEQELQTAYTTGKFTDEGWRYRKDGSRFWAAVTLTAIRATNGEIAGFLKITRDLTERKLAEESLHESEERFRLLVDNVGDYAIFMLDPEGHVMTWNTGAHRIKQYDEHEIIGSHFSVFYPLEDRTINLPGALLMEALRDGRAEDQGWRVRKDGSRFLANVIITALYDEKRELRGFAKITRDLTGQRQIEQLRESGKRKDAFLATLAHELRNPLAPILNAVELIQLKPDDKALVRELGDIMKNQIGQMTHLIDDLLDMARITTGKIVLRKSFIRLADVIENALQAVRPSMAQRRHEFVTELPSPTLAIEADPHRLTQLLTNLLSNAAKYTPDQGKITLTVSTDDPSSVEIRIKDNGIGIPLVLQSSIFELFDQGASGSVDGLGIGLTLVKTLSELHGGTISVASEGEGLGSEFTLRLPALVRSPEENTSSPDLVPASSDNFRILVADDSKNAADILAMFLRMEGYEVAIAYDGEEAIQTAGIFSPRLAFLDLGMPRINGLEAARSLRRRFPDITLIALSGWGAEDDRRRTTEAGFDLHLVKPSKPEEIRAVLSRFAPAAPAATV
ncbi:MAG: PAS domain S-box protein [Verrucomicrobiaceae bacterium]|nr:MAG: PAS domain S-box protein [Verrucomicrobiaceae bacterium]